MHTLLIFKSYYIAQGGAQLLIPQHSEIFQKDYNPI